MYIEHHTFDSGRSGKHIIFTGAVHGEEPCGTYAIRKIVDELTKGTLKLIGGKSTFIPICNPKAFKERKIYIDANLNRICKPTGNPQLYEEYVANTLCDIIKSLNADALLDIHSFRTEGKPFCFVDHYTEENDIFARSLNCPHMVTGWDEAFDEDDDSYGLVSFAHDIGLDSILVECGQNFTPEADAYAYQAILATLSHFNLIEQKPILNPVSCNRLHMDKAFFKEKEGTLNIPKHNFVPLKKGDSIATYDDGEEILMPYDGYVVLPKANAAVTDEWFYTSTLID